MKEISEILAAYDRTGGKKSALATVVQVEGSSYRREGARMLIEADGRLTGAISGGCLEGDALRRALHVIATQKPQIVKYDSREDDDEIGHQLGCKGLIHILIEPVSGQTELFRQLFTRREKAVLVTFFSLENRDNEHFGTRFLFFESDDFSSQLTDNQLIAIIDSVFLSKKTEIRPVFFEEKKLLALFEFVPPVPSLVIFGAGNDVQPLVKMASLLGWESTVIDGRPKLPTRARFPEAKKLVVAKYDEFSKHISVDDSTFFLLMTHNYFYDLAVLRSLVLQKIKYVGILGPRKKYEKMCADLSAQLVDNQIVMPENIFAPVGLDLGGSTSETIALSILAEIQAVLGSRTGGHLRDRKTPIYD